MRESLSLYRICIGATAATGELPVEATVDIGADAVAMVAGAQTVSQAVTHSATDVDEGEEAAAALQSTIFSVTCTMKWPCTCCVACKYSHFSFLLTTWDVLPGGTSAH